MTKRSETTKKNIQQAMLKLLLTNPYPAITMSDIAQQAKRTRVTVHRHYNTKDDLLLDCFELVSEEIKEKLVYPQEAPDKSPSYIAHANLVVFYTHVADNEALYRALFSTVAGITIRTRFRRMIAGTLLRIMQESGTLAKLTAPPYVVANLISDMLIGAIIWWLESASKIKPAILAEIVVRIGETGMFGLAGQVATPEDISFTPFPSSLNWANGEAEGANLPPRTAPKVE